MSHRKFQRGDWVIFSATKCNPQPSPRARDVQAARNGDDYYYVVEKCWIVAEVRPDGQLLLKTRRGKSHLIPPDDPQLRPANLWDRLRYRSRFKELQLGDPAEQSPG